MQPQENPARVLLGLYGNSTEGFLLKNQYCLECTSKSIGLSFRFGATQRSVIGPFLFTQYTVAIGKICIRHGDGYQIYVDDTQVYITFKVDVIIDQQTALARIQACIEEIRIWMILHKLMMNDSKTKFVIVFPLVVWIKCPLTLLLSVIQVFHS